MGKAKDVLLTLGMRRKEAERIEDKLRDAGVLIEEEEEIKVEEKVEVVKKRKTVSKDVSEVKTDFA